MTDVSPRDVKRAAESTWHYKRDGATIGPVPHADLCALFAGKHLSLDTQVLREGSPVWVKASTVEDFRVNWAGGLPPTGHACPPRSDDTQLHPLVVRPALTGELDGHLRLPDARWEEAPQVRPWVRFFARWLDNTLLIFAFGLVYRTDNRWAQIAIAYTLLPVAALTVYPLQLALLGRTIGKAYFGTSVENEQGRPPTFRQAFVREWRVLVDGMGVGIFIFPLLAIYAGFARISATTLDEWWDGWPAPLLVALVLGYLFIVLLPWLTMYAGYRRLRDDGITSWDRVGELVVRHRPAPVRIAVFGVVLGVSLAVQYGPSAVAFAVSLVPPKWGTPPARRPAGPEKGEVVVAPSPAPAPRQGSSAQAGTPVKPRPKPKRLELPAESNPKSN